MTSEEILASIDRHFALGCEVISTTQLRDHQARGTCPGCDLRAVAEANPRWVAAGRPMLTGAVRSRDPGAGPAAIAEALVHPPRARLEVTPVSGDENPFDCGGCPEDPRPHLHCPWGGLHKHYADEEQR